MKNKAILIDAINRKVTPVEIDPKNLQDIYRLLGCQCFTVATYFPNEDCIYVDDEGLLTEPQAFFTVEGGHQPFAGNGLVVGSDGEGGTVDAKTTATELAGKVKFLTPFEVRLQYA